VVNTREHLESLFVAKETGVSNINNTSARLSRGVPLRENKVAQIDHLAEKMLRGLRAALRGAGLFSVLGGFLAGAAALPLLPVARGAEGQSDTSPSDPNSGQTAPQSSGNPQDPGDPTKCGLLALLRHRRISVRLLRRQREFLSAGHGDVAHHLDRHLPQSCGSAELHHFVQ